MPYRLEELSSPTEVTWRYELSTAPMRIRMPITALAKKQLQQVTRLDSITSLPPVDVRWTGGGLSNAVRRASSPAKSFICHVKTEMEELDGLGARTSEARVSHSSGARTSDKRDLKSRSWGK